VLGVVRVLALDVAGARDPLLELAADGLLGEEGGEERVRRCHERHEQRVELRLPFLAPPRRVERRQLR